MKKRNGDDQRPARFPAFDYGPDGATLDVGCPLVRFTVNGEQVLENTPVEVPLGWNAPETMESMIARMVRSEVSRAAVDAGFESLDEAYDFDCPEDDSYEEHLTPAEVHAMMHAPEMREERPLSQEPKESSDVRERTGSGEDSAEDAGDGVGVSDAGVSHSREKEHAGNGKGDGRKDEAVRVRVRADKGGGAGAGAARGGRAGRSGGGGDA